VHAAANFLPAWVDYVAPQHHSLGARIVPCIFAGFVSWHRHIGVYFVRRPLCRHGWHDICRLLCVTYPQRSLWNAYWPQTAQDEYTRPAARDSAPSNPPKRPESGATCLHIRWAKTEAEFAGNKVGLLVGNSAHLCKQIAHLVFCP
jgi:hypothetical protein